MPLMRAGVMLEREVQPDALLEADLDFDRRNDCGVCVCTALQNRYRSTLQSGSGLQRLIPVHTFPDASGDLIPNPGDRAQLAFRENLNPPNNSTDGLKQAGMI
jgi:hypothetical protein